jgi:hypothetical protein
MGGRCKALSLMFAAAAASAATGALAKTPYDFHGLEFQCGRFPGINIAGGKAFWYSEKAKTWTVGTATLGKNSVTVRFPNLPAYTITQRGDKFYSGGSLRHADSP